MGEEFDIEELLKKHLSDEKASVGVDLFDQIEGQIIKKEKWKKKFFIWFWGGLIGLSCLLITFLVFNINETNNPHQLSKSIKNRINLL